MLDFLLCIDDTDDTTKSIGTGTIASYIYDRLTAKGCIMTWQVTRHQLLLDPRIPYTSHNSSMCMEGRGELLPSEIWNLALDTLQAFRSPISNPGVCLYIPENASYDHALIEFGLRAKKEVLTLAEAIALADSVPGLTLKAPCGNGNGQIGALAGIGLRLYGSDGSFRGKIKLDQPTVETVSQMKQRLGITRIWDSFNDRDLTDEEIVRADKQIKLVHLDHQPVAAVRPGADGVYELCGKATVYEQTVMPAMNNTVHKQTGMATMDNIENCPYFQWDNDQGEQWSERAGTCDSCLNRRLTKKGMKCTRKYENRTSRRKGSDT